jgi:galactonate dehydratase
LKIREIKTFLVDASSPSAWATRNWLFVKVETDEGISGLGEASGWPRVIQTAIADLTPLLIGADPRHIERLW